MRYLMYNAIHPSLIKSSMAPNGSSATEVADLNVGRGELAGFGTSTAALAVGGDSPPASPNSALAESWNGSAWTEVGDLNQARQYLGAAGGSADLALGFGGNTPSVTANTEAWNGTSWTEVNNLRTAKASTKGTPSSTSVATLASGGTPPDLTSTEEFTASAAVSTVTTS